MRGSRGSRATLLSAACAIFAAMCSARLAILSMQLSLAALALGIAGCTTFPSPAERAQHANELAAAAGWIPLRLPAGEFTLTAYLSPEIDTGGVLTIYFEGDGAAWLNRSTPSQDPTPVRPIGLELALRHPAGSVAYLARPCQFVTAGMNSGCKVDYWTGARFSPTVIQAESVAVDELKKKTGASRVILIGYSGGGAVASLVASKRGDVDRLVTVAGNLDHAAWTRLHAVKPLAESLNPADEWRALSGLSQVHFVGGRDTVVDGRIAAAYANRFPEPKPRIVTVDIFDHVCCWVEDWETLWKSLQ